MFFPVITAQEMHRVEQLAISEGCSEEAFMAEAGRKIAARALEWIEKRHLPKRVSLLVGKGNNGGDAYAAGQHLLRQGIHVRAFALYPLSECSKLNQKFHKQFVEHQGHVEIVNSAEISFEGDGLILDGFLGTGFKGVIETQMAVAIGQAIASRKLILAIDIPSGLDGTTGAVGGKAIVAHETIALGSYKSGFFLRDGWNHVGHLHLENFGLPEKFLAQAQIFAQIPDLAQCSSYLPPIVRNRHKYSAGYVVGFSGSKTFKGAPKLAGLAALRSGAGIVRVFHMEEIGDVPFSLICQKWNQKSWNKELERAGSLFIGPGIGKSRKMLGVLKRELQRISVPLIVDADAIGKGFAYPKGAILTPHRGEVLRLFGISKDTLEEDLLARCQKWVNHTKCILILKGAPTWIFSHERSPLIIPYGDAGMAKAGTGDVLTGIIAALLAQKIRGIQAAILGVSLHSLAGEAAAYEKTSYCMRAEDLIDSLPQAFKRLISRKSKIS